LDSTWCNSPPTALGGACWLLDKGHDWSSSHRED
jgi:hypothetical protein